MRKLPYTRTRGSVETCYVAGSDVQTVTKQNAATVVSTIPFSVAIPQQVGQLMTDVVTPGYRELVAKGAFINNACFKYETLLEKEAFSGLTYHNASYAVNPPTGTTLTTDTQTTNWIPNPASASFPVHLVPDIRNLKIEAANKAAANSRQRDVLGMVDIAEMRKTIDFIKTNLGRLDVLLNDSLKRDPLQRMKKKVYDKRTGKYRYVNTNIQTYKPKSFQSRAADTAGLWLEAQYGLLPLMSSIDGLVKALGTQALKPMLGQTYRGGGRLADTLDDTNTFNLPFGGGGSYVGRYRRVTEYFQLARAGLISTYQPGLMGKLGMELSDVPGTALELIKYSFVLDWFKDISTYINALTSMLDGGRRHVWESDRSEVISRWEFSRDGATYRNTVNKLDCLVPAATCSVTITERVYHRSPSLSVGVPATDFHVKSLTHLVSGVSLALSRASTKSLARI